jgi:hypothetical protein
MANKLLVTVGNDMERPGKFYWDIKGEFSRDVIISRRDFDSLNSAMHSLNEFKMDLAEAKVIQNLTAAGQ